MSEEQQATRNNTANIEQTLGYLDERNDAPFREFINDFRLGNRHAVNTPALPRTIWGSDDSFRNLTFEGNSYSLDDFSLLVDTLYEYCIHKLKTDIIFSSEAPNLMNDNNKLVDLISSTRDGYSFLSEPENIKLRDERTLGLIMNNIFQDENLAAEFFGANVQDFNWNLVRLNDWLNNVGDFVFVLAILIHLTSGQPARGTEITSYTICNSGASTRSIYWLHDTVMLSQSYSKTRSIKSDMHVVRFLPKKVANILVIYLACVRPMEINYYRLMQTESGINHDEALNNYRNMLFVIHGKIMTSRNFSIELNRWSNRILSKPLKLSSYRHMAVAFMWAWLMHFDPKNVDPEEEGVETQVGTSNRRSNLLIDEQAGHTAAVASRVYAVSNLDFRYIDREKLHNFYLCSMEWHTLLGIREENEDDIISKKRLRSDDVEMEQVDSPEPTSKRYRVGTTSNVTQILPVFLEKLSSLSIKDQTNEEETTTYNISPNHLNLLRRFLNDNNARFKSAEQAIAFNLILKNQHDLLVVLPTGGGKSLLYMLPTLVERNQQTIVVVPLVALADDIRRRCNDSGINADYWKGPLETNVNANILIITPEQCNRIDLQTHIDNLFLSSRLSRVVVDECHLTLTWSSFRESMYSVHRLRRRSVPLVLLSATVPVTMENQLRIAFASNFKVIRSSSTIRSNLKYSVVEAPQEVIVQSICDRIVQKGFTNQFGIVYVPFVNQTLQYANYIRRVLGVNCSTDYIFDCEQTVRSGA